jgi:hypothetical protein
LVAVLLAALAAAPAGAKTPKSTVSIKADSTVEHGKALHFSVKGKAVGKSNRLAVFEDSAKCAGSFKAEKQHTVTSYTSEGTAALIPPTWKVSGKFKKNTSTSAEPDPQTKWYLCAYLYNSKSKKTQAHATDSYVTT